MNCAAAMTPDPPTLGERDSIGQAAQTLITQNCSELAVVDANGIFIGMFGIHDLLSLFTPRMALAGNLAPNLRFMAEETGELRRQFAAVKNKPVSEAASHRAASLGPDAPLTEALQLLGRGQATIAIVEPVTRKLLGTITASDAMRAVLG